MRFRKSRSLRTERLTIAPMSLRYVDDLWASIRVSAREIGEWMSWGIDPTKEQTRAFADSSAKAWEMGVEWNWALLLEGRPVGGIGIGQYVPLIKCGQLGYWLRSDLAGRGLVTEAGAAVVEYAFGELGLHRLELHAAPENKASIAVARKLGFRHEGLLRHGSHARRGWHDVNVYGLLATDERPQG